MSEVISVTRAVEVRETFKPSVQLTRALEAFLSFQSLSNQPESQQATFLLRSWRRKVMKQSTFYHPGREVDRSFREAAKEFASLPNIPIFFDNDLKLFLGRRGSSMARLALRPKLTPFVQHALGILDSVPNDGLETDPSKANLLYVEINRDDIAQPKDLARARDSLRGLLSSSETARSLYARPYHVVNRDTIVNQEDLS